MARSKPNSSPKTKHTSPIEIAPEGSFVNAFSATTGAKMRVPAAWFNHPKLAKGIRKTPLQKAAENKGTADRQPDPAPAPGDDTKKGK